MIKIWIKIEPK